MNEFVLQLADTLKRCPIPWQNFINGLKEEHPHLYPSHRSSAYRKLTTDEERVIIRNLIAKELDVYGARKEDICLYFEDESYYTAFILRFGTKKD